jgi:hypothetical protein
VGDSTATPTQAILMSVVQETGGRIATILFAHRLGTSLEPECKMYRLLADIFNDAAMILDLLSPVFPKGVRVGVFVCSSSLRALCGVAAGSSKASLSAHFARWGNLGELNAVSDAFRPLSLTSPRAGAVPESLGAARIRPSWRRGSRPKAKRLHFCDGQMCLSDGVHARTLATVGDETMRCAIFMRLSDMQPPAAAPAVGSVIFMISKPGC